MYAFIVKLVKDLEFISAAVHDKLADPSPAVAVSPVGVSGRDIVSEIVACPVLEL